MSVAFAKQTELSRIARQKEEASQTQVVHQQEIHCEIKKQCGEEEVDGPRRQATAKGRNHEEELKSLCKELSEESGESNSLGEQLHSDSKPGCIVGETTHESVISEESFSHVKGLMAEETLVSVKKKKKAVCKALYLNKLCNECTVHFNEKAGKK